jgi:hypothetical protein
METILYIIIGMIGLLIAWGGISGNLPLMIQAL